MQQQSKIVVSLARWSEAHDVSGEVWMSGQHTLQLLGETYAACWQQATKWLKERGVELDQDYEVEYERGGYSHIEHE